MESVSKATPLGMRTDCGQWPESELLQAGPVNHRAPARFHKTRVPEVLGTFVKTEHVQRQARLVRRAIFSTSVRRS